MATTNRPECTVAADADECLSNHRIMLFNLFVSVFTSFFNDFPQKAAIKIRIVCGSCVTGVYVVVVFVIAAIVIDTVHAKLKLLLCVRIFIQFFSFSCSPAFYYFFIFNAN